MTDTFTSKAAKKRALDDLSRQYERIRNGVETAILKARDAAGASPGDEPFHTLFWTAPFDLHHVRPKHIEALAGFGDFAAVADLVTAREVVKLTEVVTVDRANTIEAKIAKVRTSIIEEMERRKVRFAKGLDVSRLFGLHVYVNAHWVTNDHGTTFLRHFFYLNGELTSLNGIVAIAEITQKG
jgi:hypothetical protein